MSVDRDRFSDERVEEFHLLRERRLREAETERLARQRSVSAPGREAVAGRTERKLTARASQPPRSVSAFRRWLNPTNILAAIGWLALVYWLAMVALNVAEGSP